MVCTSFDGLLQSFDKPVHVHGPPVSGFGGFHSFDGPIHLCACTWTTGFGFYGFDGPAHLCVCTWTNSFGFWRFSQFGWARPSVCMYMDQQFWVLMVLMGLSICVCMYMDQRFWWFSWF